MTSCDSSWSFIFCCLHLKCLIGDKHARARTQVQSLLLFFNLSCHLLTFFFTTHAKFQKTQRLALVCQCSVVDFFLCSSIPSSFLSFPLFSILLFSLLSSRDILYKLKKRGRSFGVGCQQCLQSVSFSLASGTPDFHCTWQTWFLDEAFSLF